MFYLFPVGIIVPDDGDLELLKEEIADWLITDQPVELIFDVEPNRTYLAVVDDSFDPDEFVKLGMGTITFICPMPYKLGPTQKKVLAIDEGGNLKAEFRNRGSVESNPIIDITVGSPSPFLDVWNDNDYFRISYPVGYKSKIVKKMRDLSMMIALALRVGNLWGTDREVSCKRNYGSRRWKKPLELQITDKVN